MTESLCHDERFSCFACLWQILNDKFLGTWIFKISNHHQQIGCVIKLKNYFTWLQVGSKAFLDCSNDSIPCRREPNGTHAIENSVLSKSSPSIEWQRRHLREAELNLWMFGKPTICSEICDISFEGELEGSMVRVCIPMKFDIAVIDHFRKARRDFDEEVISEK